MTSPAAKVGMPAIFSASIVIVCVTASAFAFMVFQATSLAINLYAEAISVVITMLIGKVS